MRLLAGLTIAATLVAGAFGPEGGLTSSIGMFHKNREEGEAVADSGSVLPVVAAGVGSGTRADSGVFLGANNSLVETHVGGEASLHCWVARESDHGTISWSRRSRDNSSMELLSVGDSVYTGDPRVEVARPALSKNWNLRIYGARVPDSGQYLCQTSHHPPASLIVLLIVYEAYATISGTKEKVITAGSEMQLVCIVKDITKTPDFFFWYHDERMINYDTSSGVQVLVSPLHSKTLRSSLTISSVTRRHSGSYSCSPSQTRPDSVRIEVRGQGEGQPEPVLNRAVWREGGVAWLGKVIGLVLLHRLWAG